MEKGERKFGYVDSYPIESGNIGWLAETVAFKWTDDGRVHVQCVGKRPFRILKAWTDPRDELIHGEVQYLKTSEEDIKYAEGQPVEHITFQYRAVVLRRHPSCR
jgi:Lon protease-like protein